MKLKILLIFLIPFVLSIIPVSAQDDPELEGCLWIEHSTGHPIINPQDVPPGQKILVYYGETLEIRGVGKVTLKMDWWDWPLRYRIYTAAISISEVEVCANQNNCAVIQYESQTDWFVYEIASPWLFTVSSTWHFIIISVRGDGIIIMRDPRD